MIEARLTELLATTPTLKLATAGGPVTPWLAAAFFAESGPFELHIMLEREGKTFRNIQASPRVAVMVESGDAWAVFAQAEARGYFRPEHDRRFRDDIIAKTPVSTPLTNLPHLLPVALVVDRWLITDVKAGWLPAKELRRPG